MARDTRNTRNNTWTWTIIGVIGLAILAAIGLGLFDTAPNVGEPETAPGGEEELAQEEMVGENNTTTENDTTMNNTQDDTTTPGGTPTAPQ